METFCYLCSWLYSTSRDGAPTYSVQAKFRASPNHVGCSLSQNIVNILQLLSLHTKRGEACTSTDTVLFTAAVFEYCIEDWVFKIPHVEQNTYFSAVSSPRIVCALLWRLECPNWKLKCSQICEQAEFKLWYIPTEKLFGNMHMCPSQCPIYTCPV